MTNWTTEQQAEHRKAWTAALRSGEYEQGTGVLRNSEGRFCCLGVASELAVKAGVIEGFNGLFAAPENEVVDWLGLTQPLGRLTEAVDANTCVPDRFVAHLNDSGDWSFDQIADLIDDGGLEVVEPS